MAKEPKLSWTEAYYLKLFQRLNTERPASMGGLMPIPRSRIYELCERFDFDQTETDIFFRVMELVDDHLLTLMREKLKKEEEDKKKPAAQQRKTRST